MAAGNLTGSQASGVVSPIWASREGQSSVVVPDGSIVLMGGMGQWDYSDVWWSPDQGATWMQLLDAASWAPRAFGSSVVLPDGSIVLMGGNYETTPLNDVWRSADNGVTWTEMTANASWLPRQDFGAVTMPDGSIILMGGLLSVDSGDWAGVVHDVWRSTDNGATWTEMTVKASWLPRQDFGAVAMPDGSIVIMGGGSSGNQYYNDVWRSTDNGATWTEMTPSAEWVPRSGLNSVALQDGSIVIMGGTSLVQSPLEYIYFNDVWRSTDNGATWTEMTSNAGWAPRELASSMTMPDGSIVLIGGMGNGFLGQDVWRSTDNGATWTRTNLAVMPPDVGTVLGSWQTVDTGGDWLNTSSTVEINSGQPSMVVLTLETPGTTPSVVTELFEMTVDQNGTVNGLKIYPNQGTINYDAAQPFPYTDTSLKGLRGTQIDNMIYAFYSLDPTHLAVSTINIADQPQNNIVYKDEVVLNTQQVNYVSDGDMMSTFQVLGAENGIYLVSKQVSSQGSPVLDISFIPVDQLGAGENSIITPQSLMQVQNSANFNPVPDNNLYSAILSNDPSTGDPLIVGVSDYQGRVYSWYIDLSNPANCGQTPMPIIASTLGSVSLFQGSTSFNPTGIDDLVAVAFSPTGSSQNWGGILNIEPGQIGSQGAVWNTIYFTENLENPYFGTPNFVGNNPINLVPSANGNMKQTMLFSSIGSSGGVKTEGLVYFSALGSNTLVPDPVTGNFNTAGPNNNFTTYGNLSVPVGIVDGVPPISLNGWPCDGVTVQSEIDLISTSSTQSTQTSVDNDFSGSVKYGGNFLKDIIGIGASYTAGVKELNTSSTGSSTTVTDEFKLSTQQYDSSSAAWLIYMAPNFVTQHVMVYDYNGNPPQAGNPMDIYLTAPSPTSPYSLLVQGYPITDPPTTGPLSGAMNSPFYNDFSAWDWTTFSGGWDDRDWTQAPGSGNYIVTPIAPGNSLDFSYGASETTQYQMTTSTDSNHESTNTVDADASIFGFGGSGSAAFTQDQTVSSSVDKGIQFTWSLAMPAQGTCGYSTVIVEPVIVTGNPGTTAPLPWVPTAFQSYQPWLITYDLLQYDSTCDVSVMGPATIRTSAIPAGSGTILMDPVNPRKGDPVHLAASPAPGYTFSHWQAYGVDLADYSSGETNGVVKSDVSTVRAFFEKEESTLVNTAQISVSGPDTHIQVSGNIPANLTWGMALDPKVPVRVIVGGKEFAFGPKEGTVQIISGHEIYFATNKTPGDQSTLHLDFSRKVWEFTANTIGQADRIIQPGYTIRLGLTAKNIATLEDLPLTGSQSFVWTGQGGAVNTPLFSFDSGTKIIGSSAYPCQDPGRDSFIIQGARFNTSAFSPDGKLRFSINQLAFEFANATARNGDHYLYARSSKDCNISLNFDKGTGLWSATLEGPRLSNNYWGNAQAIGLQMGTVAAQGTFTSDVSSTLTWPTGQSPLTAAFTGTPVRGAAPLSVSFIDRSQGSPTSWYWSFGDGSTSTERNPVHVYTVKGNYSVFLLVKNGQDTSSLLIPDYITVGTTPSLQADFVVSPVNGTAPLTVKCTDKSTGKPGMYVYNFGDGTSATGQNPVHTYKVPGNYTITLTVTKYNPATGTIESSVANKTNVITVTPVPFIMPVAKFTASPVNGTMPLSVKFTDRSEGNPTMYNYDFGDGVNETGPDPVHTYRFPGVYNVTLTVLKNDAANGSVVGNTSVQNGLIHVSGK